MIIVTWPDEKSVTGSVSDDDSGSLESLTERLMLVPPPPDTQQPTRHLSSVESFTAHTVVTRRSFVTSLRDVCRWVAWWERV